MRLRGVNLDTMILERESPTTPGASEPTRADEPIAAAFRRLVDDREEALATIYDLEGERLFALALWITGSREDAADAVHDLFVKLAANPPPSGAIRRPRAYLMSMARNAARDRMRSRRATEEPGDVLLAEPGGSMEVSMDARRVSRHLRRLPLYQREALYLRFFGEMSFADIGRVTGVSLFTAASRCRLGLAKLRTWMGVE